MRLTVGPLPPAVYWRRRAVVLGALLLAVFLLVSYCGGDGKSGAADRGTTGNNSSPAPSASAGEVLTPIVGGGQSAAPASAPLASNQPAGPCTDEEVAVIVSTEGRTEAFVGDPVRMLLKVKNISGRSCARDIGATQQELRLTQGAQKAWSSDDCNGPTGSMMRTLRPGEEVLTADMTWNGRASTNCQSRPLPAPGAYQLFGRIGTRHSDPVALTLKPKK